MEDLPIDLFFPRSLTSRRPSDRDFDSSGPRCAGCLYFLKRNFLADPPPAAFFLTVPGLGCRPSSSEGRMVYLQTERRAEELRFPRFPLVLLNFFFKFVYFLRKGLCCADRPAAPRPHSDLIRPLYATPLRAVQRLFCFLMNPHGGAPLSASLFETHRRENGQLCHSLSFHLLEY